MRYFIYFIFAIVLIASSVTHISPNVGLTYGLYHITIPSIALFFAFLLIFGTVFTLGGIWRDISILGKIRFLKKKIARLNHVIHLYKSGIMFFLSQDNEKAIQCLRTGKNKQEDDCFGLIIEFLIGNTNNILSTISTKEDVIKIHIPDALVLPFIDQYPRIPCMRELILIYLLQINNYDQVIRLLKKERFVPVLKREKRTFFMAMSLLGKAQCEIKKNDFQKGITHALRSVFLYPIRDNIELIVNYYIVHDSVYRAEEFLRKIYKKQSQVKYMEYIVFLYYKIISTESDLERFKKMKSLLQGEVYVSDRISFLMSKIALRVGMLGEARFQLDQCNDKSSMHFFVLMALLERAEGKHMRDAYWIDQMESVLSI